MSCLSARWQPHPQRTARAACGILRWRWRRPLVPWSVPVAHLPAQVRHNQYEYGQVLDDARAAMALFEEAGETGLAVDAASRAAVLASRLGELSLAADLSPRPCLAWPRSMTTG